MPIRLKVLRRQEERIRKVAELMNMWKVPGYPTYEYQPIGASSSTIDPRIQKTKDLFEMFHLIR
jgi:hypothetical protein